MFVKKTQIEEKSMVASYNKIGGIQSVRDHQQITFVTHSLMDFVC